MKVQFMKDMEMQDVLDSAVRMLKDDAPVEPEELDIRDSDTGDLTVVRFCGYCTRSLGDKPFCQHCGKKVKT